MENRIRKALREPNACDLFAEAISLALILNAKVIDVWRCRNFVYKDCFNSSSLPESL